MPNETMTKFNYPDSLLHEYQNWVVLLRPEQVTLGSMVLACKLDAVAVSEVPDYAFAELAEVTADLEGVLKSSFNYDKINYLLLMMVDKYVHFHVIPRYAALREFASVTFSDSAWPGPPDFSKVVEVNAAQNRTLQAHLKSAWPTG